MKGCGILIIAIIILFILFIVVLWRLLHLNWCIVQLCKANEAQDHLNETYGDLIVKNAEEINNIKNNIHR